MIEYVTMGQVESIIENYYKEHHSVLSFYATLVYLKQHGETSLQVSSIPDFSKWNLNDLPGLLDLFARIPIPVMVNEDNDVVENIQRNYYGKTTNIFKQPIELMENILKKMFSSISSASVAVAAYLPEWLPIWASLPTKPWG